MGIRHASATEPLDAQIGAFKESLQISRDRGDFESFEVATERELPGIAGQPAGRYAVAVLRRGNQAQRSHVYIFPVGSQHLKVRITYPEDRYTDEAIQTFVDELLAALPPSSQPRATAERAA